ncbi:MAG: bifunctional riboflavin kinase/FAD synthetase [Myxococcales bacterium]|nr:bifunctional riboflavin kinase/FAD synthetase [Myxococcales bacterium]USN50649.1 MAG: bifunctional riboflavin kinase/FAD synthetase [Myxococcales bacterium]
MKVFYSCNELGDFLKGGTIAIGNFDGVHLGHQALIHKVNEIKGHHPGGVLSFEPHIQQFLSPKKDFFRLMSGHHKIQELRNYALDVVVIHILDRNFLSLSPAEFVTKILKKQLKVDHVVVGEDFSFGSRAQGNISDLVSLAKKVDIHVHVVPDLMVEKQRCSSSAIRKNLMSGELNIARCMLGRSYSLFGKVQADQKMGAQLGFATANLRPLNFYLKRGVYASMTRVFNKDGHQDFLSATNVGVRPSISAAEELVVETHCLDQLLELNQKNLEIFFIAFLREEIKFPCLKALQEQVQKDFQAVRQLFLLHPHRFDCSH